MPARGRSEPRPARSRPRRYSSSSAASQSPASLTSSPRGPNCSRKRPIAWAPPIGTTATPSAARSRLRRLASVSSATWSLVPSTSTTARGSGRTTADDRDGQPLGSELRRLRLIAGAREQLHAEPRAADPLPAERDRRRVEVSAGGVDVGRVPQAELDVERSGDPDPLGDLVVPDEAADVVRSLDIDV